MSANEPEFWKLIRQRLRQFVFYNQDDLSTLLVRLFAVVTTTVILTYAWSLGWPRGLTWHVMYGIEAAIPGPPGPVFVAPLGFLVGLASLFGLDAYKRIQGLLLLPPALIAMFVVIRGLDRLDIVWSPTTIGVGFLFFLVGLGFGSFDILRSGERELKRGFHRLIAVVGLVSFWGIIEATVDYPPPIVRPTNPGGEGAPPLIVAENPIVSLVTETSFGSTLPTSAPAGVFYLIMLGGLVWALWDFTEYEMDKDVLLLGPDRAGKTWFMGGAGHCLVEQARMDSTFQDPDCNGPLHTYRRPFARDEFDDPLLEANNHGEFNFFSFKYEHGVLPKRRLRVQTVDYAGEFISEVNLNNPWVAFDQSWANKDDIEPGEFPDFGTLTQLKKSTQLNISPDDKDADTIYPEDIPPLLSAMIAEYDAIAFIVPADELVGDLDDDDLPDHLEKSALESRLSSRETYANPEDVPFNENTYAFFEVYKEVIQQYGDEKDLFFTVTMADAFLKTFRDETTHQDPKGNPNWDQFRRHVYDKIEDQRSDIDFMSEPMAENYENYYPVYFEPKDPPGYTTPGGEFRPYMDWDDDYLSLRGLQFLFKRMGR
ncbi:hypothetical protein [Haloplanus salilacus]|uniref:hypothetical protein n=1 Tax=Haloplanus salilacus TaxID=2949994 RepID=UPI0030CD5EF7